MLDEINEFVMPEFTLRERSTTRASLGVQYGQLFNRNFTFMKREPQASIFAKIGMDVFMSLLMLSIFWKVGSLTDPKQYFNMSGCIFFIITGNLFGNF